MRPRPNPTLIGAFVLGALFLAVGGLLVLGSGGFFRKTATYVMYFDGNMGGLLVGAPVTFRGVRIGEVKRVSVDFSPDDLSLHIPVFVEVDPSLIHATSAIAGPVAYDDIVQRLVDRGLRAKLKLQSLVTGQMGVDLDFYPDKPARRLNGAGNPTELPTIPSDIEELERTLEKLPIETMIAKATSALEGIERVINGEKTANALAALAASMTHLERLAASLNERLPSMMDEAGATLVSVRRLADDADRMAAQLEKAAQSGDAAMRQATTTLATYNGVVAKDSPLGHELHETLAELRSAARSIRVMADYLETHPEALIRGKGGMP